MSCQVSRFINALRWWGGRVEKVGSLTSSNSGQFQHGAGGFESSFCGQQLYIMHFESFNGPFALWIYVLKQVINLSLAAAEAWQKGLINCF